MNSLWASLVITHVQTSRIPPHPTFLLFLETQTCKLPTCDSHFAASHIQVLQHFGQSVSSASPWLNSLCLRLQNSCSNTSGPHSMAVWATANTAAPSVADSPHTAIFTILFPSPHSRPPSRDRTASRPGAWRGYTGEQNKEGGVRVWGLWGGGVSRWLWGTGGTHGWGRFTTDSEEEEQKFFKKLHL